MAPLIEVTGLRYTYPGSDTPALADVSLLLDAGLVAVAGPSGGGKSTVLRLLNGLVPHLHGGTISGRAVVDGHDVLRTPARRLATSVGFVFQDAERQAVHATVERDVAFGLENRGVPRAEMRRRVGDMLDRLGIAGLRERTIATLSGGERQRVAVAGALVLEPRLLVLDEPFSQLDASGAGALLALCAELRDAGTTVVVAEHRLDEILLAADALVTVDGGVVSGPLRPADAVAGLDSAPQVVRLSTAMGWAPPLLDPARLHLPGDLAGDAIGAPVQRSAAPAGGVEPAWRLDGVGAGADGLLHDVTAWGGPGEVVALMGANGAGKTTLLRVIAGLTSPHAGTVRRRPGRVAYLPQNPAALLYRESVAAEIGWTLERDPGAAATPPTAHRELLDSLAVSVLADRDPRDLSSGQRQRAAVAAILCGAPQVALLDEPTRGMDGAARAGLVDAVRGLAARGASVVVATHDSDLAAALADRVLVVADGTVHAMGSPAEALSGAQPYATQLGRLRPSPGPVTVAAWAALLRERGAASLVAR